MVIKTKNPAQLVSLLKAGATRFRALGSRPIWAGYADGVALADFIEQSIAEIQNGTISQKSARELWRIFAPTCDWDDCVGDAELGQQIFAAIDSDLRHED